MSYVQCCKQPVGPLLIRHLKFLLSKLYFPHPQSKWKEVPEHTSLLPRQPLVHGVDVPAVPGEEVSPVEDVEQQEEERREEQEESVHPRVLVDVVERNGFYGH